MAISRAAVVHNPIRMRGKRLDRTLEREEALAGWGASVRIPTLPDESTAELRARILNEPADVVIAAGGDGTVRAVAEAIADLDIPMAVWPVGSTNLFARNLGFDVRSPDAGVRAAFETHEQRVDTGLVNYRLSDGTEHQRTFLVLAGIGVDAQMVVKTSERAKGRFRWLAYVKGLAQGLFTRHRFAARYRFDDGEWQRSRLHTFAVSNGGALPAGLTLLPDARIDDGEFDLLILSPNGIRDWWQLAHWFARQNTPGKRIRDTRPDPVSMRRERAVSVSLRLERGEDFEIDGEYLGKAVRLDAVVQPGALRVRIPVAHVLGT